MGFIQIEDQILINPDLSQSDKMFYIALKSFQNNKTSACFPSMRRIAERAGMSKNTGYKCREKLGRLGLISWKTKRGRTRACDYFFLLSKVIKIAQTRDTKNHKIAQNRDTEIAQNRDTNYMNLTRRSLTRQRDLYQINKKAGDEWIRQEDERERQIQV